MRRKFLILLVTVSLSGCANRDEEIRTQWSLLALPGKTLVLIDDKELQVLPFSQDGTSRAEIGIKGVAVAAPTYSWRIEKNVLLISGTPDSDIVEELRDPAVKGSIVTATRKSGVRGHYALLKY